MAEVSVQSRLDQLARGWGVSVLDRFATASSLIATGQRDTQPVVLKVVARDGDEWHAGDVLDAFDGAGVVRVVDRADGVLLLERAMPGTPLVDLVLDGRDAEATDIIADVLGRMTPRGSSRRFPTVQDWGRSFDRYVASGDHRIPGPLVAHAHHLYVELAASQIEPRLLHGDLHHYNILYDASRGWLATDPKGVVGEVEYELGAALRNPYQRPDLFAVPSVVRARIERFSARPKLNSARVLAWAFSQAVLSAIWSIEDGLPVSEKDNPASRLARTIQPMLG